MGHQSCTKLPLDSDFSRYHNLGDNYVGNIVVLAELRYCFNDWLQIVLQIIL